MRTTSRTAILSLSLLFALSANGEIILNPRGTLATQRILSYKNYDDIRIDRDLDGKVDEWYLRKDNTEIHVSYNAGQFAKLQFKVFKGQNVGVKEFVYKNNKLVLTKSEFRPMLVMHGEAEKDSCDQQNTVLADKVSSLNEDIAAVLSKTNDEKKSCELTEFPKFSKRLSIILRDIASNPTKFNTCVAGQTIEGVDSNLVSSKLTATMAKMRENPTATDKIFTCGFTTESEATGKTTEDGRISFEIPKESEDPPVGLVSMFRLVYHELVHSAGVTNEDSIYQILKSCLEIPGDKRFVKQLNSNPTTVFMAPVMKTHTENAANNTSQEAANTKINEVLEVKQSSSKRSPASASRAGDNSVNMKNEIAKAKAIPNADELSVAKTDKSPQGKEQAVRESVSESAPLFRAANQVMGVSNTPAMADNSESQNSNKNSDYYPSRSASSRSSSSSSSGSGNAYSGTSTYSESETSSSRSDSGGSSTGSRYQSRHGRYQSKGNSGGGGVGSDEFIAEEVDLTKGAAKSASNRSPARQPAGSYQSNTQSYQPSSNSDSASSGTDETSKGRRSASAPARSGGGDSPAIAGGGGGSSINMGSSAGGGGSNSGSSSAASNSRNTARTTASSRAPASATGPVNKEQQREVMSEIVDRDHSQVRTDLKSQSFQDNLKANRIKIIDYNGNRWGDPEGMVIYLDDGSRFIRQR
ncbi:hypothetical protein ACLVWU_00380 [Bdellovibrio sp. HCB290]|uniref:hypothetical protein n=1 Tax=Bdellovibrio sp. HCB290 TaxID=3394356 RepID=UPI0039B6AAFC